MRNDQLAKMLILRDQNAPFGIYRVDNIPVGCARFCFLGGYDTTRAASISLYMRPASTSIIHIWMRSSMVIMPYPKMELTRSMRARYMSIKRVLEIS